MRKRLVKMSALMVFLLVLHLAPVWGQTPTVTSNGTLPEKFDLRDLGCVTPIKQQIGGTCWAHGTMAAVESNLMLSGLWKASGLPSFPAVSEYHLDWWNGFNKHQNHDLAED